MTKIQVVQTSIIIVF